MKAACGRLILAAALSAFTPAFAAEGCPVGDKEAAKAGGYAAAIEEAVAVAPECAAAFRLFQSCQLGSSRDNALSSLVRRKCEPLFLPKARQSVREKYRAALARCAKVEEGASGSLYQSFAAFCQARASRDFAARSGAKSAK
jgi:hypothetical protein